MRKPSKKIAILSGAMVLASAGGAYAYWTSTGQGTGTATTSAGQAAAFTVAGNVANEMYPGDAPQSGTATVTNTGTENAYLRAVKAHITTDKPGCDGSNYLLNGAAAPSTAATAADLQFAAVDIAPKGTATKTFTLQFNNKDTDQDACKGAAVTINYVAS